MTGCVGARGAQTIPNNERSDSRSCRLDTHAPPATRSKQHGVPSRAEEVLFMYLCFICGAGDSKERAGGWCCVGASSNIHSDIPAFSDTGGRSSDVNGKSSAVVAL